MIDSEGFRTNVGIIVCNQSGELLWTRRYGQNSWQFPQGGLHAEEDADQAMFRELKEEIGLEPVDVNVLGYTRNWLKYRLPNRLVRKDSQPLCIGQKQRWYMLQLVGEESRIHFDASDHPEFDHFMWVSYWYPLRQVVAFKREVYRSALSELLPLVVQQQLAQRQRRGHSGSTKTGGAARTGGPKKSAQKPSGQRHKRGRHRRRSH